MDTERDPYEGGIEKVYSERLERPPVAAEEGRTALTASLHI